MALQCPVLQEVNRLWEMAMLPAEQSLCTCQLCAEVHCQMTSRDGAGRPQHLLPTRFPSHQTPDYLRGRLLCLVAHAAGITSHGAFTWSIHMVHSNVGLGPDLQAPSAINKTWKTDCA